MRKKLGECLIQAGLITEDDLRVALADHKRTGERLGGVLVRMSLATEKQIAKALAYQLGFQYISLTENPPDPTAVLLIPKDVALKRTCIGVRLEKSQLTVAMSDPLLFSLVQDLEFQTGYRIKQMVATRADIIDAIQTCYPDKALVPISPRPTPGPGQVLNQQTASQFLNPTVSSVARATPTRPFSTSVGSAPGGAVERTTGTPGGPAAPRSERAHDELPNAAATPQLPGRLQHEDVFETATVAETKEKEAGDAAPIVDLVDLIVNSAVRARASDVHIEPMEKGVVVRHRLDGLLKEVMDLPKWVHEGLVARMKIMAGMDIAEKRLPQDGRIRAHTEDGTEVDFRVSTLRTLFGEKLVLRVLDHRKGVPSLEELGFASGALEELRHFLKHQHGMILVVGPTGSGKTTTLSSSLKSIQSERTNIITIEDPVEYQLPGINQTQINDKIKLTFASALRSILRQDPDVILVGEIRDHETARIAMQAAQTGHLVLSTLHTDDAPSTITRLTDIGAEPFVIASALIGVVAQRLVRRLCDKCCRQYIPPSETLRALNLPEAEATEFPFYYAVGCDQCNYTGYRGRLGLYEVMRVTPKLRRLIAQRATEDVIREAAQSGGMASLGDDGLQKVKSGVTTAEELLRVITEVTEMRTICPSCSGAVAVDFTACPHCGRRLNPGCGSCGRALQAGWAYCPYCANATTSAEPVKAPVEASKWQARTPLDRERGARELPTGVVTEFKKI